MSRRENLARPRITDSLSPLLLGFNAQVIQLILLREALMLSSGSEVALGLSLAVWALFNGAGSFAGWAMSRFKLQPGRFFGVLLWTMPVLLALSIHGARVCRGWVDVPPGEHLRLAVFSILAVVVLAPVTFLDGFLFVGALDRLFGGKGNGRGTAYVYGVESIGSLSGGILFTFLLVTLMNPFAVVGLLLILNVLGVPRPGRKGRFLPWDLFQTIGAVLAVAGVLAVIFGGAMNQASEEQRWSNLQPDLKWVESVESRHQNLAVMRLEDEVSVFGNGDLLFTLRSRSPEESGDWDRAVFPNLAMLQHEKPERVLLVGGGAKGFITDLLTFEPKRLDWVEYDRALVDLVHRYQIPEERESFSASPVHFHPTDGRYFVKTRPPASLDLIIVDVPDPANANLNRYYTLEFFLECRRALRKDGVLVLGLSSQPNFIGEDMKRRNGSVYSALCEVFPRVRVTAGTFSFFLAGGEDASITADAPTLVKRYEERGIESNRFSPYLFYSWFEEDDLERIGALYADGRAKGAFPVNRDDRPTAYYSDYRLFSRITGAPQQDDWISRFEMFLSGVDGEGAPSGVVWLLAVLPAAGLLLLLAARWKSGDKVYMPSSLLLLLCAVTVGFSGIVLEVNMLFAFQNDSGYLYSQMGMIIASYMAGLALGALSTPAARSPRAALFGSMVVMVAGVTGVVLVLSFLGRLLPGAFTTLIFYSLATLLLGAAGGLSFRGISLALGGRSRISGGLIYTMDILGTALGGWQAGSVLIPILGIKLTLICAGGAALVLCFFSALTVRNLPD
jgi:spermidine synthase